ncbi:MAG: SMC-Scp complex subunit ScpB [Thermoplasmatota archaeon]
MSATAGRASRASDDLKALTRGMKPVHVVEAALFAAGRPVAVEEIAEQTGLARPAVRQAIDDLAAAYKERDTVLEVGKAGQKWAMQVRTQAAEPAARFAAMEIAPKLLKTLALIAYHQPLKQSELADMIGSKVYDHIPELKEKGLVRTRRDGQTKILSTTPQFPEYFGLDAHTPQEIRAMMGKLVGLDPEAKPKAKADEKGQEGLESFDEATDASAAPAPEPEAPATEAEVAAPTAPADA